MNTTDLINEMAAELGITKTLSKRAMDFITSRIITEVRKGKQAKLTGFGIFYRAHRKARQGRNPQNGETVNVPSKQVARFKPGKRFKVAVG